MLAPYNATLGVSHLSQFSNLVYVFDNEQLFKIVDRDMILAKPTYEDTNRLVAQNMTTFSASMRYPNLLNADLRKQAENLIPFPAMIYFPTSLVHIKDTSRMTVKEAINELHNKDNLSAEIDLLTERSYSPPSRILGCSPPSSQPAEPTYPAGPSSAPSSK